MVVFNFSTSKANVNILQTSKLKLYNECPYEMNELCPLEVKLRTVAGFLKPPNNASDNF